MEDIISIDEYRKALIEYYKYKYDEDTYELRKRIINSIYSDEYLQRIINDTKSMCEYLINKLLSTPQSFENTFFTSIDIEENTIRISNGCIGGWSSDNIHICYHDFKEQMISEYILNLYLPDFKIFIHEDVVENMEDEDIGSFTPVRKLFIKCDKEIFDKISKGSEPESGPKKLLTGSDNKK